MSLVSKWITFSISIDSFLKRYFGASQNFDTSIISYGSFSDIIFAEL